MAFPALPDALMSSLSLVPKVSPTLTVAGQDITAEALPSLTSLTYKEGLVFTADTVSVQMADPEAKFRLTWNAKATLPVTLSITSSNFDYPGQA